ncbi:MAG: pilus assembly protein PilM [Planctomycetota bacterium]
MSARIVGLDMGATSTRLVEARLVRGALEILRAATVDHDELAGEVAASKLKGRQAVVGVTGRDMILRTTQVPTVPDWQLRDLMRFESEEVAEQSGDALSSDFHKLEGAARHVDDDMVLLALVRDSLIAERSAVLQSAGLRVACFTPNAVALHNAVLATDGGAGVVMVVFLGGRNTDIALLEDGELLFARNLAGGGDLFTEALAASFRLEADKAEQVKRKLAAFPSAGETPTGQRAAVARALQGPLRQLASMLQSSLVLCRSQLKAADLNLERVLLCGPGATIPGLDEALTRTLGVPVANFDVTEGALAPRAEVPEGRGGDYAVAAGLALMALQKEAWRIEILAEAARARQRFQQQTLWMVLAGVLVVAQLSLAFVTAKGSHEEALTDLARLRREVEARQSDLRSYERAVTEAREAAAKLSALQDLAAPGSGVLAAFDLLEASLPPELWLRTLRSQRGLEPAFGEGSRAFVIAEGSGKEQSRGLTEVVTDLTSVLRAQPGVAAVLPQVSPDSRGAFQFSLKLNTSVVPQSTAAAEPPQEEPR